MQIFYLALAAFAYRGLLTFGSQADLSRELEEWFFIPTEASPLVVVLLAAWLVYRRRERLERLVAEPPAWGLAALPGVLALASFAWSMKTMAPHLLAISLLFGVLAAAGVHFGRAGMRIVLLPALLLAFAVPMPAPLLAEVLYRFQLWTAESSGWMLSALGRAVYVSGDQVLLAQDHFKVIEGCSGLRSVQTLTMVAVLLVELFGRHRWHALCVIALAPFVAFALNGLRVLALILNPQSDVVAIHNLQGVAILLLGLAILYGVDGLLQRYERPEDVAEPASNATVGATGRMRLRVAAVVSGLALMSVLSLVLVPWKVPGAESASTHDLPLEVAAWNGNARTTDRTFLGTIGYRTLIDRSYDDVNGSAAVDVFVLVGDIDQRYRSPISPKTIPPGSGWIVEQEGKLDRPQAHTPRWSVMRSGTHRVLVHHWYEGTSGMADELVRGLFALDSSPWHRVADVAVFRVSTRIVGATEGALDGARARLRQFEQELEPALGPLRHKLTRKGRSELPKIGKIFPLQLHAIYRRPFVINQLEFF